MNAKNVAMTAGIGLLYVLLVTSVFLQSQQAKPLSIDDVKQAFQHELLPLEKKVMDLDQQIDAAPNVRGLASDAQIDVLTIAIEKTDASVDSLRKTVEDFQTQSLAASKSIADLARQPVSGSKLSQFLGNVESDPQLKLEFENAVKSAVPQRKWGKLIVMNTQTTAIDLKVDSPGRRELFHPVPAGPNTFSFDFPLETKVFEWTIEPPECELHLEIFKDASGGLRVRKIKK